MITLIAIIWFGYQQIKDGGMVRGYRNSSVNE